MSKWTSGYCAEWAVAYQRIHGGRIWAFVAEFRDADGSVDRSLMHAFVVVRPGQAIDAKGPRPIEAVRAEVTDEAVMHLYDKRAKVRLMRISEKFLVDWWGLDGIGMAEAEILAKLREAVARHYD